MNTSDIFQWVMVIYCLWGAATIAAVLFYRGPVNGSVAMASAIYGIALLTLVITAIIILAATGVA